MPNVPHQKASDVFAEDGEVHIDGPGGTAVSMTPEAAAETSDRLLHAATKAAGQKIVGASRNERP